MSNADIPYKLNIKDLFTGAQVFFVALGGLVIIPLFLGMNPSIALFTAGVGTILYQIITRGTVPVFLASSTTFTAPMFYSISHWGLAATFGGMISIGLMYILMGFIIKIKGPKVILNLLPPIVTGPVILVIGIIVVPLGIDRIHGIINGVQIINSEYALTIAVASLSTTVLCAVVTKGLISLAPILAGILGGTLTAYALDAQYGTYLIDFSYVANAPWFYIPNFVTPDFNPVTIIFFIPIALIPAIEQFGDMLAISSITNKNYLKSPGIATTMIAEGAATIAATGLGGPPPTTYSEVHKAVAVTQKFNPAIMTWAALIAIACAFIGKIGATLSLIPLPALSGVLLLMFASIMVIGINTLVQSRENLLEPRNLIIVGSILIVGVGGLAIEMGDHILTGVGLATIVGVLFNLILPVAKVDNKTK